MFEELQNMSNEEAGKIIAHRMMLRSLLQCLNENDGGVDDRVLTLVIAHQLTNDEYRAILNVARYNAAKDVRSITDEQEQELRTLFQLGG